MWLYAHWSVNGSTYAQPFHKPEKAVEHAMVRLHSYVANDLRGIHPTKVIPKELTAVKTELERLDALPMKSVDDVRAAIRMYEEYMHLIQGHRSPHHDIREVKMVE